MARKVELFSRLVVLLVATVAIVGACDAQPGPMASPSPTANPWLAEDEIARAVEFRQKFGLRSDVDWVREVAVWPEASAGVLAYDVPLTPAEVAVLQQRAATTHAVLAVVEAYGAEHPEDWSGAIQDTATGSVIARFTDNLATHEAALRAKLAPNAQLVVVEAGWTLADIQVVRERIEAEWDAGAAWLLASRIYPLGLSVDVAANQLAFEVSSTRTDLDSLLEAHYDAAGMLTVTSDGTGVRLLPKGTLAGRVLDRDGDPVSDVNIELESSVAGAGPHGDVGYSTNAQGLFRIPDIEAVTYKVLVYTDEGLDTRILLGSATVTVVGGKTTSVTIRLP